MDNLMTIGNVHGYVEKDGTIMLNAEDVARGWGFTHKQVKGGKEYENVRWDRLNAYLKEFNFSSTCGQKDFLPENIVYRLGFKANNRAARKFQALLADEVLPTLRKTGAYSSRKLDSYAIDDPVERANRWIEERQAFEAAEAKVKELQPKADVYDTFIDKKGSVGIRDLCNELGITNTRLGQIFREYKLAYRNPETKQWKPYKTSIDQGFMVVKTGVSPKGYIFAQMRITMKGQQFIAAIAKCEKQLPAAEVKTPSNVIPFPDPMKVAYPFDDMDDDIGCGYDDSYDSSIEAERYYDYEKDNYCTE